MPSTGLAARLSLSCWHCLIFPAAGAARGLQRALGGGAVALNQARGGGAFGLPGGCAAREQARRCSSPTPSEEVALGIFWFILAFACSLMGAQWLWGWRMECSDA